MITRTSPQELADTWAACDDEAGPLRQRREQLDDEIQKIIRRKENAALEITKTVGPNIRTKVFLVKNGSASLIVDFRDGIKLIEHERKTELDTP